MAEQLIREIFYYEDHYLRFFAGLKPEAQQKFNWTLKLIATVERVPVKFLKHIEGSDGLYEVRVEVGSDIHRVFSFFDSGRLIILINGFTKKTRKTPGNEIERAERLKKKYFHEKAQGT